MFCKKSSFELSFSPISDNTEFDKDSVYSFKPSSSKFIGASKLLKRLIPSPELLFGVNILNSALFFNKFTLSKLWNDPSIPFFQISAVFSANSFVVILLLFASFSSIYGKKSSACIFGKVRAKFVISPFGSITIEGILSIAASSKSVIPRPVFPLPVIPIIAAWVVKSLFLYKNGSPFSLSPK